MSRLDKFLVSDDWLASWPSCVQHVLDRDFSDHCPLLLRTPIVDWGPKPFRVLNCWFQDRRFDKFVQESFEGIQIHGRGAYVLKEKLKRLKGLLKGWNKDVFGDIIAKKKDLGVKMNLLELKGEESVLTQAELDQRYELQAELWRGANMNESLLHQKSRN